MLLNLSPAAASFHESLCSLRFGAQVNAIHTRGGRAKREVVVVKPIGDAVDEASTAEVVRASTQKRTREQGAASAAAGSASNCKQGKKQAWG